MSLYYGHSSKQNNIIPRSNDFSHTFTYAALTTTTVWSLPIDVKLGHPTPIPYVGKYVTEDTSVELINFTFDKDGAISNLVIELQLIIFEKGGSTFAYNLGNFDVSANMFPFSTRNISAVDKTYKLSKYHTNYEDIAFVYIKIRKVSGSTAGNESALTSRISY